jgi:N-acetylmuramoyl-L-alanine amidase
MFTLPSPVRRGYRAGLLLALPVVVLLALSVRGVSAQDPSKSHRMVVQSGDTLSDIAVRFYGSTAAIERILAANKITDPDMVVAGTVLLLPSPGASGTAAAATVSSNVSASSGVRIVTVEPGDALSTIAERLYGSSSYTAALAAYNGIPDANLVFAGMKLKAPATLAGATVAAAVAAKPGPLSGKRICLDAGHGGVEEPGAVFEFDDGRLLREADVTLDITRSLRAWLVADGASVTMTRSGDTFLGLDERAAICNISGADITVSMHLNGFRDPAFNGALALFFKMIDRKLADRLAAALQAGLAKHAPAGRFYPFGSQEFEGRVLLRTTMPAVIVEPVFLTHPGEARALLATTAQSNSRRNQIVLETYRGIRAYFGQ